ncbi:DegV family protein [Mycobacterium hubeiense]|uniref:DegV family protein n=1 Tax=Mycobacterium hubeiense TaxID=1867256 RepID=UPI000C7F2BE2|nr:DegV family protein [Mycobacterium sp. QGD 101]
MSVTVITDSVACLSPQLRARLNIGMVGIILILDGTQYRDGVDLTAEEFYARLDDTISHKTAAPSVGDWLDVMAGAVDAGADGLLVVTLAQRLSSTFDSARAAARIVGVPAEVVDSKTAAAAEGLYVRRLAEEAHRGASLEVLVRNAESRRGSYRLEFVLEGLKRLAYTGRMPTSLAKFGDAIDVKPMLTFGPEAEVRPVGAVRGIRRGIERVYRRVLAVFPEGSPGRVVVSHALLDDDARQLAERIRIARPDVEVDIALFSPVMAASTGPVIGVAWEDPALTATG